MDDASAGICAASRLTLVAPGPAAAYDANMLPEQRASSYAHDPSTATVVIVTEATRPQLHGDLPARLLLDASSHVVGLDVVPDSPERVVVMLGPHEKVSRAEEVRVHIEHGGGFFRLQGQAAKLVAPGANPYVF